MTTIMTENGSHNERYIEGEHDSDRTEWNGSKEHVKMDGQM